MTPAEHYAEAERLVGMASNESATDIKNRLIATAQVYATLATYRPAETLSRGDAERAMAHRLGLSAAAVRSAAHDLWGHALVDERDKRCPADAPKGRKGHVTRLLAAELQAHLDGAS